MRIANPIFDSIFKYLLGDKQVAIDIISTILSVKIVTLEIKPQEIVKKVKGKVRVMRIDFKAVIKLKTGGHKTVLIEIQKARKDTDSGELRFRRYLSSAYHNLEDILKEDGSTKESALPVIVIYFLGFSLKGISVPVLRVKRVYTNAITGETLENQYNTFVEQLSHDLIAIQIPKLNMLIDDRQNSELAQVLDIFNQDYQTDKSTVLEYPNKPQNVKMQRIINRLRQVMDDPDMYHVILEEEILAAEEAENEKRLKDAEKTKKEVQQLRKDVRKIRTDSKQKDIVIEQKEAELEQKDKIILEAIEQAANLQKQLDLLIAQMGNAKN